MPSPQSYRVPTGRDGGVEELRVRIVDGQLDLRCWKRSPASFSETDWHPTAAGVTIEPQYAECLIEAISRACNLRIPGLGEHLGRLGA